ncbi:MAG: DEAD/DEAH box helicase [Candidatus Odinarchaeota archaeon]
MSLRALEVAGVDARLIRRLIEIGVEGLTDIQELAVKKGLFRRKNIFICAPASSGKTLLSYITVLAMALREPKSKAVILLPLRSQADEVNMYLNRVYAVLGLNIIRLSDKSQARLADSNIIIGTFKEMDEALLVNYSWLSDLSLIVVDEFQLLGQHEKGGLLENLILILIERFKETQFIYLSDIIGNAFEISEWLGAELAQTYSHLIPVRYSILLDKKDNSVLYSIVEETVKTNGQIIVFTENLEQVIELCGEFKKHFKSLIGEGQVNEVKIKLDILRERGENTYTREYLSYFLKYGIGFHTPGLSPLEKLIVEELFNSKILKVVVSTPEIGAAVNMHPRVIVFKNTQYKTGLENREPAEPRFLNPNIIHNIFGRAGNYKYDKEAYGIILVYDEKIKEFVEKRFFKKNIRGELLPRYDYLKSMLLNNNYIEYMLTYLATQYDKMGKSQLTELFEKSLYYRQASLDEKKRVSEYFNIIEADKAVRNRTDYSTRMNAMKTSFSMLSDINCDENRVEASIISPTSLRKHKLYIFGNGYMSCDCEYWRFKASREGKLCKHLAALILIAGEGKISRQASDIVLKALNPRSLILDLALKNYIRISEDAITPTDKGRLCAYTSIPPSLLTSLITILESKIDDKTKFLKCLIEVIRNSLVELPYSSSKSQSALEYLTGVIEENPAGFEPGDFKKLLNYIEWVFNSLTMIIKYLGKKWLEDELLKFKEKLYEQTG